jgi:mRNA-degrading endonuclease RelE of RelBE toxin-antitoxin system
MVYNIETIENFRKEAKKLLKKYPSLKNELFELGKELSLNPTEGTSLGNHCYKIRLSVASKGKGKSGGARVITHVYVANKTVFLLSIYDKSEQSNISDKELKKLVESIQK